MSVAALEARSGIDPFPAYSGGWPAAKVFMPFREDAQSVSLDGLTLENADDHVSLYGRLEIWEDQAGLEATRQQKVQMEAIIAVLEARSDLPPVVSERFQTHPVRNPFG